MSKNICCLVCYNSAITRIAMRTQFNVRLPKSLKKSIVSDKRHGGGSNDIVTEVALANWFSLYTPEQRHKAYLAHNRRAYTGTFKSVSAKLDHAYATEVGK